MNDQLAELPFEVRLLFIGLWTLADREGRLEDKPKKIKAQLFPYDNFDVSAALHKLHECGFIYRYETEKDCLSDKKDSLIFICNFSKHQNPHKNEKESSLPPPSQGIEKQQKTAFSSNYSTSSDKIGNAPADSLLLIPDRGFLKPDNVQEDFERAFEDFWLAYPKNNRSKGSKKEAEAKLKIALKKDTFENITQGVKDYEIYIRHTGQSNKDAFRWLEKEGWRDDYAIQSYITERAGGQPKAKSKHQRAKEALGLA